jgi:3-hydroxyisobutyrate dehydrogenase-like beta-hydroxyacid dehydrogenase
MTSPTGSPRRIAVLGLGIIGGAWARNLIADSHAVRCWNRTTKPFPNFNPDLPEAVAGAEAIFLVVADPSAVAAILDQIKPVLGPGQLVIQSSTISAHWTRKFADEVEKTGARFVEAPFTGSKLAAERRETIYYVGGDDATVEAARPFLRPLSKEILHIGPLGSASTLKLAMNLNMAGVAQTLCESLTLCRAAGIPDETYFRALAPNISHSGLADLKQPKLIARDYGAQFSLKHMAKDLRLALETAAELETPLPQTARLKEEIYDRGMVAGWENDDFIGLIRLLARKG